MSLISLKKAFNQGDFHHKCIVYAFMKMGYSNKELINLELRCKKYNYLKKKYKKIITSELIGEHKSDISDKYKNEKVWVCWFQGIDSAPTLVKKCVNSMKKCFDEKNITIITFDNMYEYVEFPEWIVNKWKKGIITNTHLSDLLRLELLIRYGGLWLDATVLLTGEIPKYIYNQDLFLFRSRCQNDITIKYNSWFIYSKSINNAALIKLRDCLYEYWKKENKLKDYFLWHLFATLIFEEHNEISSKIYDIDDGDPHKLNNNIFEEYNEEYWKELTRLTPIHKLSNKWDLSKKDDDIDSYYKRIIEG